MAEDAVDFALGAEASQLPSVTSKTPLLGAVGLEAQRNWARTHASTYGWSNAMLDHLFHRYGALVADIVHLCEQDPSLAKPLEHASAYLRAEVSYAASHEGVLHLEDVMLHRMRLVYEERDRGLAAVPEIVDIIAPILGWDDERRAAEIASYTARAEAEEAASHDLDDASAEETRLKAADISPMTTLGSH